MLRRTWLFLTDSTNLSIIGLLVLAALYYLGAELLELALVWALAATLATVLAFLAAWWLRRHLARRRSQQIERAIEPAADEIGAIRDTMLKAIDTIRRSRLGATSGARALYELPWYMVIGNPAAGKSSAIANSGLQFPFADSKVVQGVGGTRNCDWFFTTEGILLDTAGRYAVDEEHRAEWFGFLDLLKKHRARAPINGIIIAISVAELRGEDPDAAIVLARSLRKRVQDLIERLQVFAPVYVVLTKVDLVAGFSEFFANAERAECDRVWGATMPYKRKTGSQEMLAFFEQAFDELCEGLRDMSVANMALKRRDSAPAGVFTFPMEFAALQAPLKAFLATLFEENPFQFKPVFRGFYFTSALQEGEPFSAQSRHIAQRFALVHGARQQEVVYAQSGYFLLGLFRKVIFADKGLVSQYANRARMRLKLGAFAAAALLLGGALGGWGWSYVGNRQLVADVQADFDKAVRLQERRIDLQSRLQALEVLQDRIEQLARARGQHPWLLGLGLYQGDLLERKLRDEYFAGMREVMVRPVTAGLEGLLSEMNAAPERLVTAPAGAAGTAGAAAAGRPQAYVDASPLSVEDAYNALKTYLMLADKSHAEQGHLGDQLTRYWRGWLESNRGTMPREQLVRSAEKLLSFYLAQVDDPAWPRIEPRITMVDSARENLRQVVRGMSARDRAYAEIRARASTRFSSLTVARIVGEQDQALVVGSHAVPGAFSREAWTGYVEAAIREAASRELQSTDWVLKTSRKDDLTLDASPEEIQKHLLSLYKSDYIAEWRKFMQGIAIAEQPNFLATVGAVNRLGDPALSPLAKLLQAVRQQTAWDAPVAADAPIRQVESGLLQWVKYRLLSRMPVDLPLDALRREAASGTVEREFASIGKLVAPHEKDASLLRGYLDALARLRSRLNQIRNQGDPGPGARQFMQQTLEGTGSELADALRYVDEQVLAGMEESQKQALRPLLVRPLLQVFAVIVGPTEGELNKTWQAQVVEPFNRTLADKYPFSPSAKVEAGPAEIAQVFGPDGAVAKFVGNALGALVIRRGDALSARTWGEAGIRLRPDAVQRFPGWIAPVSAGGVATASAQTVFQILPQTIPGIMEYTVEIDGQQMRYKNAAPQWTNMVHPGPQGVPGARIMAITANGRSVELFNEAGQFGLRRMIDAAARTRKDNGVHELRWSRDGVSVAVELKVVSTPGAASGEGFRGLRLPPTIVGAQ